MVYYDDASVDISKLCTPVQGIHITPIIPEQTKGAAFCFTLLIDDISDIKYEEERFENEARHIDV